MSNTRKTKKITTTVAFAVSLVFSSSGHSADVTWNGPGVEDPNPANWNIATNWTLPNEDNQIPVAGDNAILQFSNILNPALNTVNYVNTLNPSLGSVTITGNLKPGTVPVGGDMTLNQQQDALTTNLLTVDGLNGQKGIYSLGGTGNLTAGTEIIGNAGTGIFNQTGGTHTVAGTLTLGDQAGSNGTYNLSGAGSLSAGPEIIGNAGTGTFNQTGGTHTVAGTLTLGDQAGSNGTYNLSGTGSLTAGSEIIGNAGTGIFNQTGGSHSVTNTLTINSGGTYLLGGGTLNAASLLNNANFDFSGGALSVGQITNTGTLILSGAGTRILSGNVTNQGIFNLTNTTTQFTGNFNNVAGGSLAGGQLINNGTLNYSGGSINTNLTNTGTVNLSGAGSRIFDGDIINEGTFKVTDTTAVYNGNFDNQGAYLSDPSVNDFQNLNVGPQGFLTGGAGDTFIVRGDFTNSSTQNTAWNTEQSNLVFASSSAPAPTGTPHQMALASADLGPGTLAFQNNFAWDQVTLESGNSLVLVDGNSTPGAALYTSRLELGNGVSQLASISSDYNIYYAPSQNPFLSGNVFNLGSGIGQLIPEGFTFLPPPGTVPGITTNEQSFAGALDSACPLATGVLALRCRELRVLDSARRQAAVESLTPIQQLSQIAQPIKFNFARMEAPLLRMAQLRSGHVQPVSLSLNGYQIPLAKYPSALGSKARGGAAGDPDPADELFRDKPFSVFVQGKLDFGSQASNPESPGLNLDSRAITVGSDYRFNDKLVAGAAIEYNNVHTSFNNGGGSMQTNSIIGALYSSYYLPQDFYVDGLATFGNNNYALTRTFQYPGFDSRATSSPDAFQYAFAATVGKDIAWREWLFNPYTRFEYIQQDVDGYQESGGGGFAMDVSPQSVYSAISSLGTQVSYNSSQSWGILVPSIRVEWEHQYLNNNQNTSITLASAAAGTGNFVIQTGQPDRDYVNLGGSVSATLPEGGSAFVRYETRLGQSYITNHIVELGVKIPF